MRDIYVSEKSRSARVSEPNALRLVLNFGGDPYMYLTSVGDHAECHAPLTSIKTMMVILME